MKSRRLWLRFAESLRASTSPSPPSFCLLLPFLLLLLPPKLLLLGLLRRREASTDPAPSGPPALPPGATTLCGGVLRSRSDRRGGGSEAGGCAPPAAAAVPAAAAALFLGEFHSRSGSKTSPRGAAPSRLSSSAPPPPPIDLLAGVRRFCAISARSWARSRSRAARRACEVWEFGYSGETVPILGLSASLAGYKRQEGLRECWL